MATAADQYHFNMGSSAIYRIIIQGHLDIKWSAKLSGMQITENNQGETMLVGRVEDQSALNGILDILHNLSLPVLNVECLEKL
jgi:hypothetical protein